MFYRINFIKLWFVLFIITWLVEIWLNNLDLDSVHQTTQNTMWYTRTWFLLTLNQFVVKHVNCFFITEWIFFSFHTQSACTSIRCQKLLERVFIDPNTSASASLYSQRLTWQSRNPCKEQTESLEKCLSEFEVLHSFHRGKHTFLYCKYVVMLLCCLFMFLFVDPCIICLTDSLIYFFAHFLLVIHSFILSLIRIQWWKRLAIHKTHLDMIRDIPFNVTFVIFQHSPSKDVLYGAVMDKVHTTNAANNKNKKPSKFFAHIFDKF